MGLIQGESIRKFKSRTPVPLAFCRRILIQPHSVLEYKSKNVQATKDNRVLLVKPKFVSVCGRCGAVSEMSVSLRSRIYAVRQGANRNKDRPLCPARGAVSEKAQQSQRWQPRLPHRELPDRQRILSLHHVVPTHAADTARGAGRRPGDRGDRDLNLRVLSP